jgi:hypothetical protein
MADIQAAIDTCVDGDTVLLADGTFRDAAILIYVIMVRESLLNHNRVLRRLVLSMWKVVQ